MLLALSAVGLWNAANASASTYNDYLEIRTANTNLPRGSEDVVGGRLRTASGRPIHNGAVTISYAYPGERSWKPITEFKTNSVGSYFHRYVIPGTVYFRAHFSGGGGFTPVTTGAIKVVTSNAVPADGTEYVDPKTGCAYVVENGTWVGKICILQQVDSSGKRIENMYNLYEFNAASSNHVGNYLMEEYSGDPKYIEYRIPNNALFETVAWAAVLRTDPSGSFIYEVPVGGKWTWVSQAELDRLLSAQVAAAAGQQAPPPAIETVNVSGDQTFQDFWNGIDRLGGNAQLGAAITNIYSRGVSEPFTPGICGEYGGYCYP
jgi:hypothetical protein